MPRKAKQKVIPKRLVLKKIGHTAYEVIYKGINIGEVYGKPRPSGHACKWDNSGRIGVYHGSRKASAEDLIKNVGGWCVRCGDGCRTSFTPAEKRIFKAEDFANDYDYIVCPNCGLCHEFIEEKGVTVK